MLRSQDELNIIFSDFVLAYIAAKYQRWARIRTEANFGRIRTGLDWENVCCFFFALWKFLFIY